jgi:heme exporter protein D
MADFFAMGGYGFYIWSSFGVTALFMIGEAVIVVRRRRALARQMGRMLRMNSEVE